MQEAVLQQEKNIPEAKFSTGAIQATIWNNPVAKDGQEDGSFKTIVLSRRYKDKNDSWQSTSSLRVNDIPKATLVLNKAYEYLVLRQQDISAVFEEAVL
jgi:hypothetical protein